MIADLDTPGCIRHSDAVVLYPEATMPAGDAHILFLCTYLHPHQPSALPVEDATRNVPRDCSEPRAASRRAPNTSFRLAACVVVRASGVCEALLEFARRNWIDARARV